MITTITITDTRDREMTSTWEYAPANEAHAWHVCTVAKSLGFDVVMSQRSAASGQQPAVHVFKIDDTM